MKKLFFYLILSLLSYSTYAESIRTPEGEHVRLRVKRIQSRATNDVVYKDITLSEPGTLASALGDEINDIDSLVVRGPINASDFHTIWSSSFYGSLTVANLEYANLQDNGFLRMLFGINRNNLLPALNISIVFSFAELFFPKDLRKLVKELSLMP